MNGKFFNKVKSLSELKKLYKELARIVSLCLAL